jgi:hypothetical protein
METERGSDLMKHVKLRGDLLVALCLAVAAPLVVLGQAFEPEDDVGGPLNGRQPIVGAPFFADAITSVRLHLADGSTLAQKTTARYFRNSAGGVRVELLMDGFPPPHTPAERHIRTIVSPAPGQQPTVSLDVETRTAHYFPRLWGADAAGGRRAILIPIGGVRFLTLKRAQDLLRWHEAPQGEVIDEPLGSRRIDGVDTTGRRVTITILDVEAADGKARQLVDERWESPELKLIVAARSTDTRWGDVEYTLTNLRRMDPPGSLFEVPEDYRINPGPLPTGEGSLMTMIPLDAYPSWRARSR